MLKTAENTPMTQTQQKIIKHLRTQYKPEDRAQGGWMPAKTLLGAHVDIKITRSQGQEFLYVRLPIRDLVPSLLGSVTERHYADRYYRANLTAGTIRDLGFKPMGEFQA